MNVGITRSAGKQVAADEVYRRNREAQTVRQGVPEDPSDTAVVRTATTAPGSSYRQMWREGPCVAPDAVPRERPIKFLAKHRQEGGPHSHPIHAGSPAPGEGPRARQPDLEGGNGPQRVRGGDQAREIVQLGCTHEAKRDVQTLGRHPAHPGGGLPQWSQRPPEFVAHPSRRPHGEEEAESLQGTDTATGRSTASTARTDASTSSRVDAHPREKRTAPSSDVPRIL